MQRLLNIIYKFDHVHGGDPEYLEHSSHSSRQVQKYDLRHCWYPRIFQLSIVSSCKLQHGGVHNLEPRVYGRYTHLPNSHQRNLDHRHRHLPKAFHCYHSCNKISLVGCHCIISSSCICPCSIETRSSSIAGLHFPYPYRFISTARWSW